jgi:hypothetical protein
MFRPNPDGEHLSEAGQPALSRIWNQRLSVARTLTMPEAPET